MSRPLAYTKSAPSRLQKHSVAFPAAWLATAFLAAAFLAAIASMTVSTASAALLFSDNFVVTSNSQNVNQETPGTRQSGPLASSSAYVLGPDHHQVGNTETDVGQPGGVADGNHVLLAFNGWFQSSFPIDAALANGGPLTISFDMYKRSNPFRGADDNWGSFSLRAPGDPWPVANSGEFGWLFRNNGGVQMFQTVSDQGTYDVPGSFSSSHWDMTFTNTALTGSAFNGSGSVLRMKNGAGAAINVPLNQLNSTGLVLGFRNLDSAFVGIDNLTINGGAVPEPATVVLLAAGLGAATFRRRLARS